MTIGRIIETDACVAEGAHWLAQHEPRFAQALAQVGPLPLRRREDGFRELFSAISSQQLSVASAAAIWGRLEKAGLVEVSALRAATDAELQACGLSRPKIRYARSLAEACIDYDVLRRVPDAEVIQTLVSVKGIGTWTAEIYAMFSLGRADVFAHGDLALQEAAKILFNLPARPTEKGMAELAAKWSPWRSVAARILWAYYRVAKDREGIR